MYTLTIDIAFYPQLRKIDPDFLSDFKAAIREIAKRVKALLLNEGPPFVLGIPGDLGAALLQAAIAAQKCEELFRRSDKLFHGYALLLDACGEGDAEGKKGGTRLPFVLGYPDLLVVTEGCAKAFAGYFNYEFLADGFFKVTDFRLLESVSKDRSQAFWIRNSIVERFLESLNPYLLGEKEGTGLYFRGPELSGKRENLAYALSKIFPEAKRFPVFSSPSIRGNPFASVLSGIDPENFGLGARFFSRTEKSLFESLTPAYRFIEASQFASSFPRHIVSSFKLFFELYLLLYIRSMKESNLPAILVCENISYFPQESLEMLNESISALNQVESLFFIATGTEGYPDEWKSMEAEEVFLPHAGREEMLEYLSTHSPELGPEKIEKIISVSEGRLITAFHGMLLYSLKKTKSIPSVPISVSEKYLSTLQEDIIEILYIIQLTYGALPQVQAEAFFESTGRGIEAREAAFSLLFETGFIRSPVKPEPLIPEMRDFLERKDGEKLAAIRFAFSAFLLGLAKKGEFPLSTDLFLYLDETYPISDPSLLLDCIHHDCASGNIEVVGKYVESAILANGLSLTRADSASVSMIAELELAIAKSDGEAAKLALAGLGNIIDEASIKYAGNRLLGHATIDYAEGNVQKALEHVKKALIAYQEKTSILGESQANRLLGLISLLQDRVFDGMEYFANAYELSMNSGYVYESMMSSFYEAVAFYIYGNYSRALRLIERTLEHSIVIFRKDWELYLRLFAGKIHFELGNYAMAEEDFLRGLTENRIFPVKGATERFGSWLGRTLAYSGREGRAEQTLLGIGRDQEALFFLGELYHALGRKEEARYAVESSLAEENPLRFFSPETIFWDSASTGIENRNAVSYDGEKSYSLMKRAFLGYLNSISSDQGESLFKLSAIARSYHLPANDPHASLVLFQYFLVIPEKDESASLDRSTVLSKAFTQLQARSSRIDTAEAKNAYLNENIWNRRLIDYARTNKLI